MSKVNPIPPEIVDYFDYNPETGIITRKIATNNRVKVGEEVGTKDYQGYIHIQFKRKIYRAHRLAYFIYYGVDPSGKQIDHIDGNPSNNKIDNLRLATQSQNGRNKGFQKNNTSGVVGVYWHEERQKWMSYITINGKRITLGRFHNKEEAKAARIAAEKKYFGEFRNDCNDNI